MGMEGENARRQWLACQDDDGRFVLVSLLPLHAPPAWRVACAELFARISAWLGLGHFELDFSDGQLGYRTSVPVPKRGRLQRDLVGQVLHAHHLAVDRFIPMISTALFAGVTPVKALGLTTEPPPAVGARASA
jgi:hypothetical protein